MCRRTPEFMHACIHACMYVSMYVCMYAYVRVRVSAYACVYVCMCVYVVLSNSNVVWNIQTQTSNIYSTYSEIIQRLSCTRFNAIAQSHNWMLYCAIYYYTQTIQRWYCTRFNAIAQYMYCIVHTIYAHTPDNTTHSRRWYFRTMIRCSMAVGGHFGKYIYCVHVHYTAHTWWYFVTMI